MIQEAVEVHFAGEDTIPQPSALEVVIPNPEYQVLRADLNLRHVLMPIPLNAPLLVPDAVQVSNLLASFTT
jgi:hypothetical protein